MSDGIIQSRNEAVIISNYFPELGYLETEAGGPSITGDLRLTDELSNLVDSYCIKIIPSPDYPFRFPHVFELGNRIPINIDWHVFSDGRSCIKSIPEEILTCKNGITLQYFIEKEVKLYFFNQKFREQNGYFLRERSHGDEGNIEFFKEVFQTKNLDVIAKGLLFITQRKGPTRVSQCFCGSGAKYRKCHRSAYRKLTVFTNEELDMYAKLIFSSLHFAATK
jgi:hypothetical protein